jgi:hypothetical protein
MASAGPAATVIAARGVAQVGQDDDADVAARQQLAQRREAGGGLPALVHQDNGQT